MTVEFSRPLVLSTVPEGGRRLTLSATAEERAALARRLDLVSLDRLDAEAEIRPERGPGGIYRVTGRMRAAVVQSCVVTLEPVPQEVEESLDWRVIPGGTAEEDEGEAPEDMAEGPEDVEAAGGVLDVGEALAQQLSLALDPYPRAPGAALDPGGAGDSRSPFAALSRLRRDG
ncbi:DUF177 domain-containing protein [Roseomonas sp. OT10]|uniref:YceD family protein n=1 Tax=Roseomonas cutis TaxID=2897332 RepID=UPI001E40C0BE|nr:DUF177 domain-containing protein [Roseomonas sp. OT10]UFN50672.1 DUF177 domain-containing protein [Roseomonas sp. OT10]